MRSGLDRIRLDLLWLRINRSKIVEACCMLTYIFFVIYVGVTASVHIHPDHLAVTNTNPAFGLYVYPSKEDFVSTHVRLSGMWNHATSALMTEFLKSCGSDSVLLDFGANIGWYSLLAASKGYSVHAIEPSHKNFRALSHSVTHNHFESRIKVHHNALSSEVGGALCMKGIHGPHGNIGNVALTAENYHHEKDFVKACPEEDRVDIVPLDAIVPIDANWGLAIIGCDGCEARALLGARTLLEGPSPPCGLLVDWHHPNTLNIEGVHTNDVLSSAGEVLVQAGYTFYHPRYHVTGKTEIIDADTSTPGFWKHHFTLLAVHPSERCFPPDSAKWQTLKEDLLNHVTVV